MKNYAPYSKSGKICISHVGATVRWTASGRIYVHFIYTGNKYEGHILSARIKQPK